MNIVFIGMPASGKSAFGKYVADFMKMQFIDTDSEILKKYGSIETLFKSGGEPFFREIEKQELLLNAQLDNTVIATGGGSVLCEEAMKAILKNALVVYLYCDNQTLVKRILNGETKRPLLPESEQELLPALEALLQKRQALYLKYSQITLDVNGILTSRNMLESSLTEQCAVLLFELLLALEKRVHKEFK